MNLEKYLNILRWEADITPRIIRVKELNADKLVYYNVVLIPQKMDEESGVSYRIDTDNDEIKERMELWRAQFAVLGAWPIAELVRGAMFMEDSVFDYFESEV